MIAGGCWPRAPQPTGVPSAALFCFFGRRSVVDSESFAQRIESMHGRVAALRRGEQQRWPEQDVPEEPFEEIHSALEELLVADEELRQQNEALAAAREALEAERQRYQELFEFAPDGYLVTDT